MLWASFHFFLQTCTFLDSVPPRQANLERTDERGDLHVRHIRLAQDNGRLVLIATGGHQPHGAHAAKDGLLGTQVTGGTAHGTGLLHSNGIQTGGSTDF